MCARLCTRTFFLSLFLIFDFFSPQNWCHLEHVLHQTPISGWSTIWQRGEKQPERLRRTFVFPGDNLSLTNQLFPFSKGKLYNFCIQTMRTDAKKWDHAFLGKGNLSPQRGRVFKEKKTRPKLNFPLSFFLPPSNKTMTKLSTFWLQTHFLTSDILAKHSILGATFFTLYFRIFLLSWGGGIFSLSRWGAVRKFPLLETTIDNNLYFRTDAFFNHFTGSSFRMLAIGFMAAVPQVATWTSTVTHCFWYASDMLLVCSCNGSRDPPAIGHWATTNLLSRTPSVLFSVCVFACYFNPRRCFAIGLRCRLWISSQPQCKLWWQPTHPSVPLGPLQMCHLQMRRANPPSSPPPATVPDPCGTQVASRHCSPKYPQQFFFTEKYHCTSKCSNSNSKRTLFVLFGGQF